MYDKAAESLTRKDESEGYRRLSVNLFQELESVHVSRVAMNAHVNSRKARKYPDNSDLNQIHPVS